MDEAELIYPRSWGYRIIGSDEAAMRALVADVVGSRPHRVATGQRSSTGAYVTLRLELEVFDEADRDEVFGRLRSDPAVKFVL